MEENPLFPVNPPDPSPNKGEVDPILNSMHPYYFSDNALRILFPGCEPTLPLTPAAVLAQLRAMDPWPLWRVSSSLIQEAGLEGEVSKSFCIEAWPYYSNASREEKFHGFQSFVGDSLEDCLSLARAAFDSDLDAQIKVLTRNRMECEEDLPVLRECLHNLAFECGSATVAQSNLRVHLHEIIENIESRDAEKSARSDKDNAACLDSKEKQSAQDELP